MSEQRWKGALTMNNKEMDKAMAEVANEQQEWTLIYWATGGRDRWRIEERSTKQVILDDIHFSDADQSQESIKRVLSAINAALAAERQRFLSAQASAKHYRGLFEEIRQAVQPLTPTDATKKEIIDCVKSLASQVLSAQAAIEQMFQTHINQCEQCSGPDDGCEQGQRLEQIKIESNSSALREHDAEVRKPLVEVLRDSGCRLRELTRSYEEHWGKDHTKDFHDLIEQIDALAKVKEPK